jgi:DNA-binding MltR family transcriptional regulator
MKWVDEHDIAQVQVTIALAPNSLKQGGVLVYFPPDTSVEPVVDRDRDSFKLALENESERGCVLVASAFLDHVLVELLCKHFSNKSAGDKLVRGFNSPLGTFSSRITAAFALGLLAESEHKQLDLIRRIRNDFAHTFANVRFSDPAIKDRVQILPAHPVAMSSAEDPTRQRFESAVEVLLSNLRHRLAEWPSQEALPAALPWRYPCDESGAMKISGTVELGVELRDPWLMSLADRAKKK